MCVSCRYPESCCSSVRVCARERSREARSVADTQHIQSHKLAQTVARDISYRLRVFSSTCDVSWWSWSNKSDHLFFLIFFDFPSLSPLLSPSPAHPHVTTAHDAYTRRYCNGDELRERPIAAAEAHIARFGASRHSQSLIRCIQMSISIHSLLSSLPRPRLYSTPRRLDSPHDTQQQQRCSSDSHSHSYSYSH